MAKSLHETERCASSPMNTASMGSSSAAYIDDLNELADLFEGDARTQFLGDNARALFKIDA